MWNVTQVEFPCTTSPGFQVADKIRPSPKRRQPNFAVLLRVNSVDPTAISHNPPGFYLDESATAYNAYLVSRTGAGEFGSRLPLLFQFL